MAGVILAWDPGKYKSVACVLDPCSGETRFKTVPTTPIKLEKLFRLMTPWTVTNPIGGGTVFAVENTRKNDRKDP